jgi:hypothetical protein
MPRLQAPQLSQNDLGAISALLKLQAAVPPAEALGCAAAFFFHAAQHHPDLLRAVLNEPIVKHGFIGQSLLSELTRVARS